MLPGIQNIWPNPFSASTRIAVYNRGASQLRIYNLKGSLIRVLELNSLGLNELIWDGCDAQGTRQAAGIYLISFTSGNARQLRKLVFNR